MNEGPRIDDPTYEKRTRQYIDKMPVNDRLLQEQMFSAIKRLTTFNRTDDPNEFVQYTQKRRLETIAANQREHKINYLKDFLAKKNYPGIAENTILTAAPADSAPDSAVPLAFPALPKGSSPSFLTQLRGLFGLLANAFAFRPGSAQPARAKKSLSAAVPAREKISRPAAPRTTSSRPVSNLRQDDSGVSAGPSVSTKAPAPPPAVPPQKEVLLKNQQARLQDLLKQEIKKDNKMVL